MTEQELRQNVANNLIHYRKLKNITQSELAQQLNYSDKSISKWERAEGLPDVVVLAQLADLFGVTLNDMVCAEPQKQTKHVIGAHVKRRIIPWLSVGLVWLVASVIFAGLKLFAFDWADMWLIFIYGLPVSCIVLTVFSCLWWGHGSQILSISGIVWFTVLSLILTLRMQNSLYIILVAAVFQILVAMWYYMKHKTKKH